MSEFSKAMAMFGGGAKFSSAVQKINYPFHKGQPNPAHGKFMIVGSIPANCWDAEKDNGPFSPKGASKKFDTEDAAICALIDGGADYIQGADCRKIDIAEYLAAA